MLWHVSEFHSFLRLSYIPLSDIPHFVYSSINGHLGCFHLWLLSVMLLGTWVYKYLSICFQFWGCIYLEVELLEHMITLCLIFFLRNHHNSCNILRSHQQCTSVSISQHSRQHILFSVGVIQKHF